MSTKAIIPNSLDVSLTFPSAAAARRASGYVGTKNSKMPGSSYPTDPFQCKVGEKLSKIEGSVCSKCYARRLAKMRPSVALGYSRNQTAMESADQNWIDGVADQIHRAAAKTGNPFHRWFDAGDLPSVDALRAIVKVCISTPSIKHWLPTREIAIVRKWEKSGGVRPSNLVIRESSTMVGDAPRSGSLNTSTVHRKNDDHTGLKCEASNRGGQCGDCRSCWDPAVTNVSYPLH
jgi:hypothetical protein